VQAKRLFVSLDLPESVAQMLVRLNPSVPGVRWLAVDQIHLTLAFLGNVAAAAEEKLSANLRAIQFTSFFLPLHGLGSFPASGRPKIIWIGVGRGHPHLFQLHKRVTDAALAAGIEADLRPWRPHVTLARCQNVSAQALRPFLHSKEEFDGGLIPIDGFYLKSTHLLPRGSTYHTELTIKAKAVAP